jgi:hypothetical protein
MAQWICVCDRSEHSMLGMPTFACLRRSLAISLPVATMAACLPDFLMESCFRPLPLPALGKRWSDAGHGNERICSPIWVRLGHWRACSPNPPGTYEEASLQAQLASIKATSAAAGVPYTVGIPVTASIHELET